MPTEVTHIRRPQIIFLSQVRFGGRGETFWFGAVRFASSRIIEDLNTDIPRLAVATAATKVTTYSLDYDNEASGPFTLGESITATGGKSGVILKLTDNGSTGTIIYKLTGSQFVNNDTITGASSSATADVNGTPVDLDTVDDTQMVSVSTIFSDRIFLPGQDHTADPKLPWVPGSEGMSDGVFFIRENSDGTHEFAVDPNPLSAAVDGNWSFVPYRYTYKADDAEDRSPWNFYGILVNGQGPPIRVGRVQDPTNSRTMPAFAPFWPNNMDLEADLTPVGDPTEATGLVSDGASTRATFVLTRVNSAEVYMGSVCYGGFSAFNPQGSTAAKRGVKEYPEWVVFSQPAGTEWGAYQVSFTSAIQVGSGPSEPVTRVVANAQASDTMGIRGQLLIMTSERIFILDGFPPVPGDDTTSQDAFLTPILGNVGCWAAETAIKTPYGVIFLGTDANVYLAPLGQIGPPIRIGDAIQPALKDLSVAWQRRAAAAYYDNHYMLSIPIGSHEYVEYWTDLRTLGSQEGPNWVGPQTGRNISAFAVGIGASSRPILMGAEEGGATVAQLMLEKETSDPIGRFRHEDQANAETDQVPIKVRATSNPLDFGSIHTDKLVRKVKVGIGVDDATDITLSVAALGSGSGTDTDSDEIIYDTTTETVQPNFGRAGVVQFDSSLASDEEVRPVDFEMTQRTRGKAFIVDIEEEPNSGSNKDPKVKISDVELHVKQVTRE